jgi:hypothetical protein
VSNWLTVAKPCLETYQFLVNVANVPMRTVISAKLL